MTTLDVRPGLIIPIPPRTPENLSKTGRLPAPESNIDVKIRVSAPVIVGLAFLYGDVDTMAFIQLSVIF